MNFSTEDLLVWISKGIVILLCLPIHEMAHGYAALLFGDDTAKRAGRLTLDPRAHLDPLGLIAMFVIGIGWAKPVPVRTYNMKKPQLGQFFVSFAGPFANLTMAFLFLVGSAIPFDNYGLRFVLQSVALSNIWLAIFNLIPLLPLDGGQMITALLPRKLNLKIGQMFHKYQGIITVALLVVFYLGIITDRLTGVLYWLFMWFYDGAIALVGLFV